MAANFRGPANTSSATTNGVHELFTSGQLNGPVVPLARFGAIRWRNRPDYPAITVLADLVSLYKPTFDVQSGEWKARATTTMAHYATLGLTARGWDAALLQGRVVRGVIERIGKGADMRVALKTDAIAALCGPPTGGV